MPRLPLVAQHPQLEINLQSRRRTWSISSATRSMPPCATAQAMAGVLAELLFDEWISPVASPGPAAPPGQAASGRARALALLGDPNATLEGLVRAVRRRTTAALCANFSDSETPQRAAWRVSALALIHAHHGATVLDAQLVLLTAERLRSDWSHFLRLTSAALGATCRGLRTGLVADQGYRASEQGTPGQSFERGDRRSVDRVAAVRPHGRVRGPVLAFPALFPRRISP